MAKGRISRLHFYDKTLSGIDANIPYWQCRLCKFWNGDLRNICVKCNTGKKTNNCKRSVKPNVRLKKINEQRAFDLIIHSGITGMSEAEIGEKTNINPIRPVLNELRTAGHIFHDLTDNKWKPIEFKTKRNDDLRWVTG